MEDKAKLIIKVSQELDILILGFRRGEVSSELLEAKRAELHDLL